MQHLYRQITGLQGAGEFESIVLTRSRENADTFWYWKKKVREIHKHPLRFLRRTWYRSIKRHSSVPLSFRESRDILYELRRSQAELLHVYFGHVAVELLPVLRCCSDLPLAVSFHGADAGVNVEGENGDALREVFHLAAIVMARSSALMEDLKALGCPPEKLHLLRTGIPLDGWEVPERTAPVAGDWRLLQACRLVEKKGLLVTLEAFAELHAHYPEARLTLAGDGPLEATLRNRAQQLGVGDVVDFPGFLNEERLREAFANAHIFVHPSQTAADGNREGVPNALLEAMAFGLPVVSTVHGGIPEAVQHGVSGWLVAEGDVADAAKALRACCDAPEIWRETGIAARKAVEDGFSQQSQVAAISALYKEALRNRVSAD